MKVATGILKIALKAFSNKAPHIINDRMAGGVKLQPIIDRIPLLCMINFQHFTLKPRNKYLLMEYTPAYSEEHDCNIDTHEQMSLIFGPKDKLERFLS